MLFNSLSYLLFLPVVLLLYWLAPSRVRLPLLLAASYAFYMYWKAEYGLLLLALTAINFLFGFLVSTRVKSQPARRLSFIAAIATNLATLALFKYTNFFIETGWTLMRCLQSVFSLPVNNNLPPLLPIILPLGISFFVFEFIHYLADVYKGQEPIKSPLRFGLFAAFFPSQIAGPIKRFEDFDAQALEKKRFDPQLFQEGLFLIAQGMFKKVALGDNLAPLVNLAFANYSDISALDAWAAVLSFTLQIYYDFSGYTDIGRGSANLLGYRLPENFNMPYLAKSAAEFWHRWHMSLSTWLRDYLYIPMGGSRHGKVAQMRNLLITMILGGLWHGASWTFVLWGVYQGLGLVVCHSWEAFAKKIPLFCRSNLQLLWDNLARIVTLLFVMFGWVLFRAENLGQFGGMTKAMLGFGSISQSCYDLQIARIFLESPLPLAFTLYAGFNLFLKLLSMAQQKAESRGQKSCLFQIPAGAKLGALAAFSLLILALGPRQAVPFIYFQF